jgi:hypothetical protein
MNMCCCAAAVGFVTGVYVGVTVTVWMNKWI